MYQNMLKVAQDIAMQRQSTGQVNANDTICVICTASKRFYSGVSYQQMQNGMMIDVHAEIDALQNMQAAGDGGVEFLLLVNAVTGQSVMPCSGCINFILGQNPNNVYCNVVFPDRMVPITQLGSMGNNPYNTAAPAGGSPYVNSMPYNAAGPATGSLYMNSMPYNAANPTGGSRYQSSLYNNGGSVYGGLHKPKKAGGSKLKGRVGDLLNAGKDIGADEEKESKFISKLFNDDIE